MNKTDARVGLLHFGVCLLFLGSMAFPATGGGKEYPMQGTVTALGTSQQTTGGGGTTPVFTRQHRTYMVKTDARIFVLECPYYMDGLHIGVPSECGGKKKIALGDTIHFRVEKNNAFVLNAQGREEKLRVVSEAMNADGTTAPVASQQP
jgi:hypothetical protein